MKTRYIRILREKHNIPLCRLAACSGVSRNRLTQIELEDKPPTAHMSTLVDCAMNRLIEDRRRGLDALEADYARYRDRLLDYSEEETP